MKLTSVLCTYCIELQQNFKARVIKFFVARKQADLYDSNLGVHTYLVLIFTELQQDNVTQALHEQKRVSRHIEQPLKVIQEAPISSCFALPNMSNPVPLSGANPTTTSMLCCEVVVQSALFPLCEGGKLRSFENGADGLGCPVQVPQLINEDHRQLRYCCCTACVPYFCQPG